MARLLLIWILISCSYTTSAQKIRGYYYGQYRTGIWSVIDTSKLQLNVVNDSIEFRFKRNGKFELVFRKFKTCPAQINSRYASGTFKVAGDTVYLQSRIASNKFYNIDYIDSNPKFLDSTLVVISPELSGKNKCLLQGHPIRLVTDYGLVKNIQVGDSVRISNQTHSMTISMECPTSMDWFVDLSSEKISSTIKLNLLCSVNKENLGLDNVRLLVKNDSMHMLDEFYFLGIENGILLKNNR